MNDELEPRVGDILFAQAVSRYVEPEISRRLASGEIEVGAPVFAFLIMMKNGDAAEVLLNREIPGTFKVKATRAMNEGDEVSREDFDSFEDYKPTKEIRERPYIVALHHRDGWGLTFDLNSIHPDAEAHYEAGVEFFETAKSSLAAGHTRAFVDNAHSAAELFARSELLCSVITAERVAPAKSHPEIKSTYNAWGNLGNTDPRYAKVLNVLGNERKSARYLRGNRSIDDPKANEILLVLEEMRAHVASILSDGHPPGKEFRVYATEQLVSGQFVSSDNCSLSPPAKKKPKPDEKDGEGKDA